jgi:hypothetical protein
MATRTWLGRSSREAGTRTPSSIESSATEASGGSGSIWKAT